MNNQRLAGKMGKSSQSDGGQVNKGSTTTAGKVKRAAGSEVLLYKCGLCNKLFETCKELEQHVSEEIESGLNGTLNVTPAPYRSGNLTANNGNRAGASKPQATASKPQAAASKTQAAASKTQAPASKTQALASKHQASTSTNQAEASTNQTRASKPQAGAPNKKVSHGIMTCEIVPQTVTENSKMPSKTVSQDNPRLKKKTLLKSLLPQSLTKLKDKMLEQVQIKVEPVDTTSKAQDQTTKNTTLCDGAQEHTRSKTTSNTTLSDGAQEHTRSKTTSNTTLSDGAYPCGYCPEKFATNVDFMLHMREHESERKQKHFYCSECGGVFSSQVILNGHTCEKYSQTNYISAITTKPMSISQTKNVTAKPKSISLTIDVTAKEVSRQTKVTEVTSEPTSIPGPVPMENKITDKADQGSSIPSKNLGSANKKPSTVNIFSCTSCPQLFLDRADCLKHMEVHEKKHTLVCKGCNAVYDNLKEFEKHVLECRRAIKVADSLKHMQGQDKSHTLFCKRCNARFESAKELLKHVNECRHAIEVLAKHLGQKRTVEIESIGEPAVKTVATVETGRSTEPAVKTVAKPIVCVTCNAVFGSPKEVEKHISESHLAMLPRFKQQVEIGGRIDSTANIATAKFVAQRTCRICNRVFGNEKAVEKHISESHPQHAGQKKNVEIGKSTEPAAKTVATVQCNEEIGGADKNINTLDERLGHIEDITSENVNRYKYYMNIRNMSTIEIEKEIELLDTVVEKLDTELTVNKLKLEMLMKKKVIPVNSAFKEMPASLLHGSGAGGDTAGLNQRTPENVYIKLPPKQSGSNQSTATQNQHTALPAKQASTSQSAGPQNLLTTQLSKQASPSQSTGPQTLLTTLPSKQAGPSQSTGPQTLLTTLPSKPAGKPPADSNIEKLLSVPFSVLSKAIEESQRSLANTIAHNAGKTGTDIGTAENMTGNSQKDHSNTIITVRSITKRVHPESTEETIEHQGAVKMPRMDNNAGIPRTGRKSTAILQLDTDNVNLVEGQSKSVDTNYVSILKSAGSGTGELDKNNSGTEQVKEPVNSPPVAGPSDKPPSNVTSANKLMKNVKKLNSVDTDSLDRGLSRYCLKCGLQLNGVAETINHMKSESFDIEDIKAFVCWENGVDTLGGEEVVGIAETLEHMYQSYFGAFDSYMHCYFCRDIIRESEEVMPHLKKFHSNRLEELNPKTDQHVDEMQLTSSDDNKKLCLCLFCGLGVAQNQLPKMKTHLMESHKINNAVQLGNFMRAGLEYSMYNSKYKCLLCSFPVTFRHVNILIKHMRERHLLKHALPIPKESSPMVFKGCVVKGDFPKRYRARIDLVCQACGLRFFDDNHYLNHLKTHDRNGSEESGNEKQVLDDGLIFMDNMVEPKSTTEMNCETKTTEVLKESTKRKKPKNLYQCSVCLLWNDDHASFLEHLAKSTHLVEHIRITGEKKDQKNSKSTKTKPETSLLPKPSSSPSSKSQTDSDAPDKDINTESCAQCSETKTCVKHLLRKLLLPKEPSDTSVANPLDGDNLIAKGKELLDILQSEVDDKDVDITSDWAEESMDDGVEEESMESEATSSFYKQDVLNSIKVELDDKDADITSDILEDSMESAATSSLDKEDVSKSITAKLNTRLQGKNLLKDKFHSSTGSSNDEGGKAGQTRPRIQLKFNYSNVCTVCHKVFKYEHHLKEHERIHTKFNYSNVCTVCHKVFKYEHHLKEHERGHHTVCTVCHKVFKYEHHLKEHERIHTGDRPLKCECGKTFRHSGTLSVHRRKFCSDSCNLQKSTATPNEIVVKQETFTMESAATSSLDKEDISKSIKAKLNTRLKRKQSSEGQIPTI